jgi:hypothetical protein
MPVMLRNEATYHAAFIRVTNQCGEGAISCFASLNMTYFL